MTIAFGHGISVTPLELCHAAAALVNGGFCIRRPCVKQSARKRRAAGAQQVISPRNLGADAQAVAASGRARDRHAWPRLPGTVVGGKTGTADKVSGKHYAEHKLLSYLRRGLSR